MPHPPDEERWLPVPGYAAWYEASDAGNICSLGRAGTRGGLLVTSLNSRGYRVVSLCKYGRVRTVTVGSLVLRAFRGPPEPGQRARHGAKGPRDDSLANLCWGLPGLTAGLRRREVLSTRYRDAQLVSGSFEVGQGFRGQAGTTAGMIVPESVEGTDDVLQGSLVPGQSFCVGLGREGHSA